MAQEASLVKETERGSFSCANHDAVQFRVSDIATFATGCTAMLAAGSAQHTAVAV